MWLYGIWYFFTGIPRISVTPFKTWDHMCKHHINSSVLVLTVHVQCMYIYSQEFPMIKTRLLINVCLLSVIGFMFVFHHYIFKFLWDNGHIQTTEKDALLWGNMKSLLAYLQAVGIHVHALYTSHVHACITYPLSFSSLQFSFVHYDTYVKPETEVSFLYSLCTSTCTGMCILFNIAIFVFHRLPLTTFSPQASHSMLAALVYKSMSCIKIKWVC